MRATTQKALRIVAAACMLGATTLATAAPAHATEECVGTTTNGHGGPNTYSGDCVFMRVYTATDGRIVVKYWGNQDYDFYQLRWSRPGRGETQSKVRGSGSAGSWWALNNAWEKTPYTFKIQACYSSIFGSDCTPWDVVTYTKWSKAVES